MRLGDDPGYRATVIRCDRYEARSVWEEARTFLEQSVYRGIGDLSEKDLQDLCFSGDAALLTFIDPRGDMVGSAVTQIMGNQDGRMILKILAFGASEFEATRHCLAIVEADAKSKGVQAVQFHGRPGWKRVCGPMGYEVKQVIMERVL